LEGLFERLAISEGETAMWSGQMSMDSIWTRTMAFTRRSMSRHEKDSKQAAAARGGRARASEL